MKERGRENTANFIRMITRFIFWFSYFIITPACCLSNETDLFALLAFKSAITDKLGALNSWNVTSHFCSWEGITCSRYGQDNRVVEIDLKSQGLEGFLSPYIGNLSYLRTITLQTNTFHGQIPQEIGLLSRLEFVEFSDNSFEGTIPTNLSRCSNLVYLDLSNNSLSGIIPPELTSLYKLQVLDLTNNHLFGSIPPSIGNLTSLTNISLNYCGLTGKIPVSFSQLQSLMALHLMGNKFNGSIPPGLFNISTIDTIELANTELEGTIPANIGITLPNLRLLLLSYSRLSGEFPVSLSNASSIERIGLLFNKFTGQIPKELARLSSLRVFVIENNFFNGDASFISSLTNCTNLNVLRVGNNLFSGLLPDSVANLSSQLQVLVLSNNQIYGNIPSNIGNLYRLTRLHLSNNFLEGPIPLGIGNLYNLIELDLGVNRFTNELPSSLGNLTSLNLMLLGENRLCGSLPKSLFNSMKLVSLNLSHNNFNGLIPQEIISMHSLNIFLDLSHNAFTGSILSEVGLLINLAVLDLSNNRLSGFIPNSIGSCISLQWLHLEGNSFQGEIPQGLSALTGLQDLDLSRNNLSGQIPNFLSQLHLKNLNLSFNNLHGEIPKSGVFGNKSIVSIDGNKELCGRILELKLPPCSNSSKKNLSALLKILIPIVVSGLICSIISIHCIQFIRKKRILRHDSSSSLPSFLHNQFTRLSYVDLRKATDGFSDANLVGVGRFGSVYKGTLPDSMSFIAVKVINISVHGASDSFMAEYNVLRNIRHRNLLKILSICDSINMEGNTFKAIVYKYMANGSLEKWLHDKRDDAEFKNLSLIQRIKIAIDIAQALEYLHCGTDSTVVHGDLKPSNILLDHDMTAYIGDFGLARIISRMFPTPENSTTLGIKGTLGYVAPEYGMSVHVSTQGDVYSYGIILLEMFTKIRPTDNAFEDHINLHNLVRSALPDRVMEIVDPLIKSGHEMDCKIKDCILSLLLIGIACSREMPMDRMSISDVVQGLQRIKDCNQEHLITKTSNESSSRF